MSADPVSAQLDLLARLLEENGYALEVDYAGATITVWTEAWPVQLRVTNGQPTPKHEVIGEDENRDED
jgi:hypothetical protein